MCIRDRYKPCQPYSKIKSTKGITEEVAGGMTTSRTGAVIQIIIIQISEITEVILITIITTRIKITLIPIIMTITVDLITNIITIIIIRVTTIIIIIIDDRITTIIQTDPKTKAGITHRNSIAGLIMFRPTTNQVRCV